jgi:hypothetical protein
MSNKALSWLSVSSVPPQNKTYDTLHTLIPLLAAHIGEGEARRVINSRSAHAWTIYDNFTQDTPYDQEDDQDDDKNPLPPLHRDCTTRALPVGQNGEASPSTKTQRRLTKKIDRTVRKRTQRSGDYARRIIGLDSRWIRAIPRRPGTTNLTNNEVSASLQYMLGAEDSFAMRGATGNTCGTMGDAKSHAVAGCIHGSHRNERHNASGAALVHHLKMTRIHGTITARHSKTAAIHTNQDSENQGKKLEPGDVIINLRDTSAGNERTLMCDLTFVELNATANISTDPEKLLDERFQAKKDKYAHACTEAGTSFSPLVFTAGGRVEKNSTGVLMRLFGIEVRPEIRTRLMLHIFLGIGLCPRGFKAETHDRINHLKGFLMATSGICARSTARALIEHSPIPLTGLDDRGSRLMSASFKDPRV